MDSRKPDIFTEEEDILVPGKHLKAGTVEAGEKLGEKTYSSVFSKVLVGAEILLNVFSKKWGGIPPPPWFGRPCTAFLSG